VKIQVYSQELTDEVKITRKGSFAGVSFVLASHPRLHNEPDDDDRSMVTFWVAVDGRTMDRHAYARVLRRAADMLDNTAPVTDS
jgi:hypothetical protein